jgi:hypothetical protein
MARTSRPAVLVLAVRAPCEASPIGGNYTITEGRTNRGISSAHNMLQYGETNFLAAGRFSSACGKAQTLTAAD